jgi:hypothetical protein
MAHSLPAFQQVLGSRVSVQYDHYHARYHMLRTKNNGVLRSAFCVLHPQRQVSRVSVRGEVLAATVLH